MNYLVRYDEDPKTDFEISDFHITGHIPSDEEESNNLSLRVTLLLDPTENLDFTLEALGKKINKIEIFEKETDTIVYTSNYWNIIGNSFTTYNRLTKKVEVLYSYVKI